jgi:hypothetical protein
MRPMRFSIRDLLLLTVIAGLGVGWWLDHRKLDDAAEQLREERTRYRTLLDRMSYVLERNSKLRAELETMKDDLFWRKGEYVP